MHQVLVIFPDTPPSVLDTLARATRVIGPIAPSEDWLAAMREVEAVITVVQPQFTAAVMDASPRLRVIGRPGIGVDNVDLRAATERGICVVNTPDAPTQPVVEKVIAWILMLAHRLRDADRVARVENWAGRSALLGNDVFGKTLGLIGVGRVGSRVAQICSSALGMRVLAFDPYVNAERMKQFGIELVASVDALMPQCDFVSINCPLTPETRGLIGEKQLRAMKASAYLINSARAPVVDEDALVRALRERWIRGAALDVFTAEPPPAHHPLLALDNVIVAPHLGSFTQEAMLRMLSQTADQVLQVLRGERPTNLVNAEVWERRKA